MNELFGNDPRVRYDVSAATLTTYRVGGTVRALVEVASERDLDELAPVWAGAGLEVRFVGNGSNLLIADGSNACILVRLGGDFEQLSWRDEGDEVIVRAGAGLDLPIAARRLAAAGVVGFEWAVGVPGTFGGAVVMNAGGHGSSMAASVQNADVMRHGRRERIEVASLGLRYRGSDLCADDLVTAVTLQLGRGDADQAQHEIREIVRWRREHQPGGANAGSVFRNPEGDHAARLIELVGAKGLRYGTAEVSTKHANFIQSEPGGRANDVMALITEIRRRVHDSTGIWLRPEHHFIGFGALP